MFVIKMWLFIYQFLLSFSCLHNKIQKSFFLLIGCKEIGNLYQFVKQKLFLYCLFCIVFYLNQFSLIICCTVLGTNPSVCKKLIKKKGNNLHSECKLAGRRFSGKQNVLNKNIVQASCESIKYISKNLNLLLLWVKENAIFREISKTSRHLIPCLYQHFQVC